MGGGLPIKPRVPDLQRVRVSIANDGSSVDATDIGSAAQAVKSKRVTAAEKVAIRNVLHGMELIRGQSVPSAGVSRAIDGVQGIVLRVDSAPAQHENKILIPTENPFTSFPGAHVRTEVLFPMDVALHELTHAVQESTSGAQIGSRGAEESRGLGGTRNFDAVSVGEGLADAEAMLTLGTAASGGNFFGPGSKYRAVRDFDHPTGDKHVLSKVTTSYDEVVHSTGDPHEFGGVAAEIFHDISTHTSDAQALVVLQGVLEDPVFTRSNQSWFDLRDALVAQASMARDRSDPALAGAIASAMTAHDLVS